MKRFKTKYPGVFYREATRIGGKGLERVYYIVFKKGNKLLEEKVGRQYADAMTPAKAAHIRAERIEGKRLSRKEIKQQEESLKRAAENKWTIDRLWDEYKVQKLDSKGLRTDTGRYENYLKDRFGAKQPQEIIHLDIDRLRINLMKKLKPQTVKLILALLVRVINFGFRKGLCEGLKFSVEMPKINNIKIEDLTVEQIKNLLAVIDKDEHPIAGDMMKLALSTGMRRGEMFRLRWEDVDFERGFIYLRSPKGGRDQRIPLNEGARELLAKIPKTKSAFVFPGRHGNQRTDINKAVREIKTKAGLPKNFRALHGLRHVYASMLASSGKVDLYVLQRLLTHKTPLMTQRYAHLRDETLKQASDVAADILKQVAQKGKAASNGE